MAVDLNQFHQTFFEESLESINDMESELLHIDNLFPASGEIADIEPIREQLNTIFRGAHSIKGGASTFGFEQIANFTHILETLLDNMRDGICKTTKNTVTVLLQSADVLRSLFDAAQTGKKASSGIVRPVMMKLEEFAAVVNQADSFTTGNTEDKGHKTTKTGWHIVFMPHKDLFHTGNDPLRILRAVTSLGNTEVRVIADKLPRLGRMDPESSYLGWEIILKENIERSELEQIFSWVEDDCDLDIRPARKADMMPAEKESVASSDDDIDEETSASTSQSSGLQSIRVNTRKIDDLVDLVGELVITQTMLSRFNGTIATEDHPKLWASLTQLERNTRTLQESVMNIRMLPIGFAFNKLPRVVRDVSQQLEKQVSLKMSGESTELDKSIIESISDALMHIVRNSVDHGIESPAERKKTGKPETGSISINAYQQGGNVIIEIQDDGRGLDTESIRNKAIERNLITSDTIVSDSDICDFIFAPGFSTAQQITGVSGRGVGLDVVRTNLAALGGGVDIENSPGHGTRFRLRLPLTLAIMDGLCVEVGDHTYIVPLLSVMESVCLSENQISRPANGSEIFQYNDEHYPLLRLSELFGVTSVCQDISQAIVIVLESDNQNIGILVDNILGQQQVVVKSLEAHYKKVEGIATATILGDGEVALILDVPSLSRLIGKESKLKIA